MSINLSIIMPCYNGEDFIAVAIESVIKQRREDIELIIVDDGSVDNTKNVCEKYVSERVRYIYSENMGAGHARNVGMDNARGRWIAFLDCDDAYLHESINEAFISKLLLYEKNDVDIIYTPRLRNDMELKAITEISFPEKLDEIRNNMPSLSFATCIYRRSFLRNCNIRFFEYRKQDIESAFRYLTFSNAKKIENNREMMFYLQRDNLVSNTHTWNHYDLYEVKAKIFIDLFERTSKEIDRPFLLETSIANIVRYYKLCLKHGYFTIEGLEGLHSILKKAREEYKSLGKSKKLRSKMAVMDYTWQVLKLRKARIKERAQAKHCVFNTEEIMERLKSVSADVKGRVGV